MFRVILLGSLLFSTVIVMLPTNAYAISLDDDEEDAEDVADLLAEAKKAGKNESFEKADKLLKKAKSYGVNSEDVKKIALYIKKKKKAKADRLERERKERERLARLKREKEERARQARLATQNSNNYTPSYSNSSVNTASLKVFECSYQCRTSGFVFYDHLEFSITVKAYKNYEATSKVENYAHKQCKSMIGRETGLRMWDTSIHCNQKYY